MKSTATVLAVLAGAAVLAFDLVRGLLVLTRATYWSTGEQPRPVLDGLAIAGLAVSVLLLAGAVTAMIRGMRRRSPILLLILAAVTAVACAGLLVVHIAEADLTADGFRQVKYRAGVTQELTFYNTTAEPVTLCLGVRSTCNGQAGGPAVLGGAGLTLAPGEARSVEFPASGAFHLTVARPAGLTQSDTVVTVDAAPDSGGGADIPY